MQEQLDYTGGKNREDIGRTLATEKFPNTMDGFWFSVSPDVVINPFDFVTSHRLGWHGSASRSHGKYWR